LAQVGEALGEDGAVQRAATVFLEELDRSMQRAKP
jgi:hypothetical protein